MSSISISFRICRPASCVLKISDVPGQRLGLLLVSAFPSHFQKLISSVPTGLTKSGAEDADQSREISPGRGAPSALKGHGISEEDTVVRTVGVAKAYLQRRESVAYPCTMAQKPRPGTLNSPEVAIIRFV